MFSTDFESSSIFQRNFVIFRHIARNSGKNRDIPRFVLSDLGKGGGGVMLLLFTKEGEVSFRLQTSIFSSD